MDVRGAGASLGNVALGGGVAARDRRGTELAGRRVATRIRSAIVFRAEKMGIRRRRQRRDENSEGAAGARERDAITASVKRNEKGRPRIGMKRRAGG